MECLQFVVGFDDVPHSRARNCKVLSNADVAAATRGFLTNLYLLFYGQNHSSLLLICSCNILTITDEDVSYSCSRYCFVCKAKASGRQPVSGRRTCWDNWCLYE